MVENWVAIPGYEGNYEVSSEGRVRSLPGLLLTRSGWRWRKGQVLSRGKQGSTEYPSVNLYANSKGTNVRVHRLVAETFIGPCPVPGYEVCHGDGDIFNNAASNLRWDTRSSNQLDQVRHGTHPFAGIKECGRGHAFTPQNTFDNGKGGRGCHACRRWRYAHRDLTVRRSFAEWEAEKS